MNEKEVSRIITELAKDNEKPLEELFTYYYPRLYNFSKSFLKSEEGIDDILQEVFVKIWQNRKKIKSSVTFNSFIFTITKNLLLNELRSSLNNQTIKEEIRKRVLATEYSLMEEIEFDNLKENVDNLILKLPDRQKEIFILSRIEGLSYKEITEKLGITTKTVEYHMSLAISFLRSEMKKVGLVSVLYLYLFL